MEHIKFHSSLMRQKLQVSLLRKNQLQPQKEQQLLWKYKAFLFNQANLKA